jgi:hypothetical protein
MEEMKKMKNNKAMVLISWVISALALLTAVLISDGVISKNVIGMLVVAVVWFIIGIIYWKRAKR